MFLGTAKPFRAGLAFDEVKRSVRGSELSLSANFARRGQTGEASLFENLK